MRALGVDEGSDLEQLAHRLLFSCERITHQLLPLYVMERFVSRAGGYEVVPAGRIADPVFADIGLSAH